MMSYSDAVALEKKLENFFIIEEAKVKKELIGFPLFVAGDFFKDVFSQVFGFQWVINLSSRLHLPYKKISLPTFSYHYCADLLICGYTVRENEYLVSAVNFWVIPFNYIARNIGKMLGWALVSLFTVPVYVGIKALFSFRKLMVNLKIDKILKELDPVKLSEKYYVNPSLSMARIAKHCDATSFSLVLINKRSERLRDLILSRSRGCLHSYGSNLFYDYKKFNAYKKFRKKTWVVTKSEKQKLKDIVPLLDPFTNCFLLGDLEEDSKLFLEYGEKFLRVGRPDCAFSYFSKTPKNTTSYREAMEQCAAILQLDGQFKLAEKYYQKAGNARGVDLAKCLESSGGRYFKEQPLPALSNAAILRQQGVYAAAKDPHPRKVNTPSQISLPVGYLRQ